MRHALIVDDSKSIRLSLRTLMESLGFSVSEAKDGAACLQIVRLKGADLIITDLDMPVMDGFTLCRELKSDPATRSIPIIIFSSLDNEDQIAAGFCLGAWAFISKNTPDELEKCVANWLDRHQEHQGKRGLQVLVVDDSTAILENITNELSCDGYLLQTACNGQQALQLLNGGYRPDIIVSDLYMPELDGFGLLKQLRRHTELSSIPVIIMSTDTGRSAVMRASHAGAASYLTKPFGSGQLSIHIERILSDQFLILDATRKRLEREQELFIAAMTSLVNALEARDHYTRGHSESVAEMAALIGNQLGMDDMQLERLRLAGRLHDLGKIGIRDAVLLKQGELTPEEFEHIKTHTVVVETILSPLPAVQDLLQAATSHHERWDGSGYPKGLKEHQIPLLGRIIAVADVYDALTSDRPYHPKINTAEAVEIIGKGSGTHFCPDIVKVFQALFSK